MINALFGIQVMRIVAKKEAGWWLGEVTTADSASVYTVHCALLSDDCARVARLAIWRPNMTNLAFLLKGWPRNF